MSKLARRTLVAALLTVGVGGVTAASGVNVNRESPSSPGCGMVLTVGHVPGRLDKVWLVLCGTATKATPT